MKNTETLRNLINSGTFLHLPSVYDPLSARQVEQTGFEATYVGGYVSGASKAISEPLLTLTEQVNIASEVANSVSIPVLADAGAGFGEPLHSMRTSFLPLIELLRPRWPLEDNRTTVLKTKVLMLLVAQ